jgi:NhaA family Na+:H+ antiporter
MRFSNLFREFTDSEKSGGLVLLGCTLLSLGIANSSWGAGYLHMWHAKASLPGLDLTVEQWINDGLMAVFFLLVGLEIEREIYAGELRDIRKAAFPVAGALGGMVVPAAIYWWLNRDSPTQSGFGIPMATDIAFALGMLSLAGKRVPHSLRVFLTALAIIDDLGAIFVIALFYNKGIDWLSLGAAGGIFAFLLLLNRVGVNRLVFYVVPGVFLWYFMLRSGVHATLAGVLLAFAIPFRKHDDANPSYRLQHALHKPVALVILPLFALANTGIILNDHWYYNLGSPHALGIVAGLVIGKPVGILLFCAVLAAAGLGRLPTGTGWKHLTGAALLGGIGFTMSIFISNLAFADPAFVQFSKLAVLVASLVASVLGLGFLAAATKQGDHSSIVNGES